MSNLLCSTIVEFIGSLVFFAVILQFTKEESTKAWCAFPIGMALIASILFGGKISGGHFNPAVTIMDFVNNGFKKDDYFKVLCYIVAQILAGVTAVYAVKYCSNA